MFQNLENLNTFWGEFSLIGWKNFWAFYITRHLCRNYTAFWSNIQMSWFCSRCSFINATDAIYMIEEVRIRVMYLSSLREGFFSSVPDLRLGIVEFSTRLTKGNLPLKNTGEMRYWSNQSRIEYLRRNRKGLNLFQEPRLI